MRHGIAGGWCSFSWRRSQSFVAVLLTLSSLFGVLAFPAPAHADDEFAVGTLSYRVNEASPGTVTVTGVVLAEGYYLQRVPPTVSFGGQTYDVTDIGPFAFMQPLWQIELGDATNLKTIGDSAFVSQPISSVTIPDGVTTIGEYAFSRTHLDEIVLPDSVTSLGVHAFSYSQLKSAVLSKGLTEVPDSAFLGNKLTSVQIPDGVTSVGDYAFQFNQLTSVALPDTLAEIGSVAFAENRLPSIEFPEGLSTIGESAFNDNELTTVTFPRSLSRLESAFNFNRLLTSFVFVGPIPLGSQGTLEVTGIGRKGKISHLEEFGPSADWVASVGGYLDPEHVEQLAEIDEPAAGTHSAGAMTSTQALQTGSSPCWGADDDQWFWGASRCDE